MNQAARYVIAGIAAAVALLSVGRAESIMTPDVESASELLVQAHRHYAGATGKIDDDKARSLFLDAAATGDPVARLRLASLYHLGSVGLGQDPERADRIAAEVFDAALARAQAGEATAQFCIGNAYLLGLGRPAQPERSIGWFERAAENEPWASHNLGWMYETGTGTRQDPAKAVAWYERAARAGYVHSMYELGVALVLGQGKPADPEGGVRWLARAAEGGYVAAQAYLGYLRLTGDQGVTADLPDGARWTLEAVVQGNRKAFDDIVQADSSGRLSASARQAVVEGLERGSAAGNAHAMAALSELLSDGRLGVRVDQVRSFRLALAAAEKGSPQAMHSVGFSYWKGRGAPLDRREAANWWRRGAELGDHMAQYRLGLRLLEGAGVAKDLTAGCEWLERSADQGFWAATLHLARTYEHGWYGVRKDSAQARYWFERAAGLGVAEARGWLRAEASLGDG